MRRGLLLFLSFLSFLLAVPPARGEEAARSRPPRFPDPLSAPRTWDETVVAARDEDQLWSDEFALPVSDGYVYTMARYHGDLIVGGSFRHIAGVAAKGIARWDGSTWSPLGEGTTGTVTSLAAVGDSLIVGGGFGSIGGSPANGMAAWNGTAWSSIEMPWPTEYYNGAYVLALREHDGALYVGGNFYFDGHPGWRGVMRWDGARWDSLGMGVQGTVYSIASHGSSLCVGGSFTVAGTVESACVAEWNGSDWLPLAGLIGSPYYGGPVVRTLASFDGHLYAGGYLSVEGQLDNEGFAEWDGSAWSAPAVGLHEPVTCMATYGSRLAVGVWGAIVAWDGSAVADTIRGFEGTLMALRAEGTDLLACGDLRVVPPEYGAPPSAFRVARWDGSAWRGFETWTEEKNGLASAYGGPAQITGLESYRGRLLAVGEDFLTGGEGRARRVGPLGLWDGSDWSEFPRRLPDFSYIRTMAVDADTVWAGGSFYGYLYPPYGSHSVLQFDGAEWSALDTLPSAPTALAKVGGSLYAASGWTYPERSSFILRRGAGQWETIGTLGGGYFSGGIQRLLAFRGRLIAIGSFRSINDIPLAGIAEWDGTTWRPLQYGFESCSVESPAAAVFGNRLLAAPRCPYPPFNHAAIMSWDGTEWSPLLGLTGRVTGMEAANGTLIVVGELTIAETGEAATTVSWDGFRWTRLGTGIGRVDSRVYPISIAEFGGAAYFGGIFFEAGGKPSVGIARWNGPRRAPLSRLPWLSAGRPNPFRAASDFTFRLDVEASVRVAVYDVRGREVVVLDEGFRVPGTHAVRWDGRDRASRQVPAGIYFLSVRTRDGELASRKIVRLR